MPYGLPDKIWNNLASGDRARLISQHRKNLVARSAQAKRQQKQKNERSAKRALQVESEILDELVQEKLANEFYQRAMDSNENHVPIDGHD